MKPQVNRDDLVNEQTLALGCIIWYFSR